jgi:K+-sensing histidine kinase KdpD
LRIGWGREGGGVSAQMETFHALNHTGLREIVVSIDDSTSARRAVATAVQIAMRLGLQLHLVTVHRSNGTGAEYSARRTLVEDTRRSLVTCHPELKSCVDTRVVVDTKVACALCEAYPNSEVVIGTDLVTTRPRGVFRSVANDLARQADHHPIIVVGPRVVDRWRPGPVALALDGSPLAESALPAAIGWATAFGVSLEIVQVVAPAASALTEVIDCSPTPDTGGLGWPGRF